MRVVIWGDGSVGTGLAVVLSQISEVVLLGPVGSGRGSMDIRSVGFHTGAAAVMKAEAGDAVRGDHCLVAVKSYDIPEVSRPAVASAPPPCICVSNGMGLERLWGVGWDSEVEPALLTAGFRLTHPGIVETYPGKIIAAAGGAAASLFKGTSIEVDPTEDIELARWVKWLVNSVINPIGAISGAPTDELRDLGLYPLMQQLFDELLLHVPSSARGSVSVRAQKMLDDLLNHSGNRCSMLQDIEAGRRTEIDCLTGLPATENAAQGMLSAALTALVKAKVTRSLIPRN